MTRGKSHDIEPEAESLSYIDFESPQAEFGCADLDSGTHERYVWMYERVKDVIYECSHRTDADYLQLIAENLVMSHTTGPGPYDLNENTLWEAMARWCHAKGYDTYDSDTRFEVFPGGTKEEPE